LQALSSEFLFMSLWRWWEGRYNTSRCNSHDDSQWWLTVGWEDPPPTPGFLCFVRILYWKRRTILAMKEMKIIACSSSLSLFSWLSFLSNGKVYATFFDCHLYSKCVICISFRMKFVSDEMNHVCFTGETKRLKNRWNRFPLHFFLFENFERDAYIGSRLKENQSLQHRKNHGGLFLLGHVFCTICTVLHFFLFHAIRRHKQTANCAARQQLAKQQLTKQK
jgi:hypothetical protein